MPRMPTEVAAPPQSTFRTFVKLVGGAQISAIIFLHLNAWCDREDGVLRTPVRNSWEVRWAGNRGQESLKPVIVFAQSWVDISKQIR
jgi:hypothetical protein